MTRPRSTVREVLLVVALVALALGYVLPCRRCADRVELLRAEIAGRDEDEAHAEWRMERLGRERDELAETLEMERADDGPR